MSIRLFLSALLFFIISYSFAQAPSWQWGKRGGTPENQIGYGPEEDVNAVTTDKWGNMYVAAVVANFDINIDGHVYPVISGSYEHATEVCIASYTCDGQMRWYKMVYGLQNEVFALKTDTLGGVYVAGRIIVVTGSTPAVCMIGDSTTTDTTFGPVNKTMFLMKLDTGGAYKWLNMPEPDTLPDTAQESGVYDMDVDGGGNCYLFCSLRAGAYAHGEFIATDSPIYNFWFNEPAYILQFDKNGFFHSGFHLPMWHHEGNYGGPMTFLTRDSKHHRTYITGEGATTAGDSFYVAGHFIDPMYLACFDDSANLKWIRLGNVYSPAGKPAVDEDGNVYITSGTTDSTFFNGSLFTGIMVNAMAPYIVKLDTNGNNLWAINGSTPIDIAWGTYLTIANDTIGLWGGYSAPYLAWDGDTLPSAYYTPYIARFKSSTGALISIDTLPCNQPTNAGNGGGFSPGSTQCVAGDQFGNFYVGGNFSDQVEIPGSLLTIYGGETDFFIAKFGTANCTVPEIIPVLSTNESFELYPNPTTGNFTIQWNLPCELSLFRVLDITGREVHSTAIHAYSGMQEISLPNLVSGMYFYELVPENGKPINGKILLER